MIMENDNIYTISQADDETAKILGSHDFRTLLKRVGQAGTYRFKSFLTEYGNTVAKVFLYLQQYQEKKL